MPVVKNIIELHGRKIGIKNKDEGGVRTITMIKAYQKRYNIKRKTILVVDDSEAFCQTVKARLERSRRFKIITAFNGKDGIRIAKKTKPDLILLDVIMPHMDGLEVLEKIKESEATMAIPVVMLTDKDDDESKGMASYLCVGDYITKPVGGDELYSKIKIILGIGRTK